MCCLGQLQYMEGHAIAPKIQDAYVSIAFQFESTTAAQKLKLVDYTANEAAAVTVVVKVAYLSFYSFLMFYPPETYAVPPKYPIVRSQSETSRVRRVFINTLSRSALSTRAPRIGSCPLPGCRALHIHPWGGLNYPLDAHYIFIITSSSHLHPWGGLNDVGCASRGRH